LDDRILWLTQSKAFSKSQKMPPSMSLLFKATKISLVSLYIALLVADLVLRPNCSSAKILSLPLCSELNMHSFLQYLREGSED